MKNPPVRLLRGGSRVLALLIIGAPLANLVRGQAPEMQQRVAEIKTAAAMNKQALAQMTWVEQVTISLKGEQKKVEHFQVRVGPDGKPQKTSIDPPATPPEQSGRHRRIKEHVVEKKKEEYKAYADEMKALAQQYLPPDKELIEQAYSRGGITIAPAGAPDEIQLIIRNYVKPQDSMTLVIDRAQKQLLRVEVASYLSDTKDAVTVTVQFGRVQGGSSQVSNMIINGVSKQLNIAIADSNYEHS